MQELFLVVQNGLAQGIADWIPALSNGFTYGARSVGAAPYFFTSPCLVLSVIFCAMAAEARLGNPCFIHIPESSVLFTCDTAGKLDFLGATGGNLTAQALFSYRYYGDITLGMQ